MASSTRPPLGSQRALRLRPASDDLITLQEAARLLRRTERTVHRYLEAGKLTSTLHNRQHRLSRREVQALARRLR